MPAAPSPDDVPSASAVEAWRTAIRNDTFARYHFQMGLALAGTGEHAVAAAAFERAVHIDPAFFRAQRHLVETLTVLGRTEQAAEAHRRALAVHPAYAALGELQAGREDLYEARFENAERCFKRALDLAPDLSDASDLLNLARAAQGKAQLQPFRPSSERQAAETALDGLDVGMFFSRSGRLREAGPFFARAVELNPNLAEARGRLGQALAAAHRNDEAIESLELAVRMDDGLGFAWAQLGVTLQTRERYADAEQALRHAIDLLPGQVWLQGHLGMCQHLTGNHAGAIETYDRALAADPNIPWIYGYKGMAHQALGDVATADACYADAAARDRTSAWAASNRGLSLLARGKAEAAATLQRRAIAWGPDEPWQYTNHGLALSEQGQTDAALASFHRAAVLDSEWIWQQARSRPWAEAALTDAYERLGVQHPARR